MKKVIFLIMLSVLLLGLIACSNQKSIEEKQNSNTITEVSKDNNKETNSKNKTNKDVREKVWEQLSQSQKENIRGTWEDAKIQKITLKPGMGKIDKGEYIGKEVYIVDFPKNQSINNLLVYADLSKNEIIGYGYTD